MKANKFRLNYPAQLLLVIAFITMQLSITHIHQAEQHNHNGSDHQHQVKKHTHILFNQLTTTLDSSHQTSHAHVITIDHEYNRQKRERQKNLSTSLVATFSHLPLPFLQSSIKIPVYANIKLSLFDCSTDNPRAPPKTA